MDYLSDKAETLILLPLRSRTGEAASWVYKLSLLSLFSLAYAVFYVFPNFNPLREPRVLPLLMIDEAVPFLPWTFIVYLSEFLLIATAMVLMRDTDKFNLFARNAFGVLFIIGTIFLFFPTYYPRPDYPTDANIIVTLAMKLIAKADAPTNCFPSLHVAITSVAVYALRFLKRPVWFLFFLWGMAIIVSTLTTKQHYLVDILGGLIVAVIVIRLDKVWLGKTDGSVLENDLWKKKMSTEK